MTNKEEKSEIKSIEPIKRFCKYLQANKVKESKTIFLDLPVDIQKIFLEYSWKIISNQKNFSKKSIQTAGFLFKLFRSKEMKTQQIFKKYEKLKDLNTFYNQALEKKKTEKKIYVKQHQKHEIEDENDPKFEYFKSLKLFYTTLYDEIPTSKMAIKWLTEYGIYDKEKRKEIEKKYKLL